MHEYTTLNLLKLYQMRFNLTTFHHELDLVRNFPMFKNTNSGKL